MRTAIARKDMEWLFSMSAPEPNSGCWLWTGALDSKGYGNTMTTGRRFVGAHRLSYETAKGPIPTGLDIDHICRVRCCVNPAHLEAVTHRENILRGNTVAARKLNRTHCPAGHEFSGSNLRVLKDGSRRCRECANLRAREFRSRHSAKPEGRQT